MYITLTTEGKNDSVDYVTIKLFAYKQLAEEYCKQNTDSPMNNKYWKITELVQVDKKIEVSQYLID
jgi:hypothetical protein